MHTNRYIFIGALVCASWVSSDYKEWQFRTTGLSILLVLFTCVGSTH